MRAKFLIATLVFGFLEPGSSLLRADTNQEPPVAPFFNNVFPKEDPTQSDRWRVAPAFPNLEVHDPMELRPGPEPGELVVAERRGLILAFENRFDVSETLELLDIRDRIYNTRDTGIMSFVFHPKFGQSPDQRFLYVFYAYAPEPAPQPGYFNRLSRFTIAPAGSSFDPDSELVLLQQYDRVGWHNGGSLVFGNDGFLYVSLGDEGYQGDDAKDSTQRLDDRFFSGVLRIDVDADLERSHPIRRQPAQSVVPEGWPNSFSGHYQIPNDNPFLSDDGSVLEEFWAVGLRSPHRMSCDPVTGRIWIGDVGWNVYEEINLLEKGANYGWPFREGKIPGPIDPPEAEVEWIGTRKEPLLSYSRNHGRSIIGGYVYRGGLHPQLEGNYIFGDNRSFHVWSLEESPDASPAMTFLADLPEASMYESLSSFGVDHEGELYLLKLGKPGSIFKLEFGRFHSAEIPVTLSATGLFEDLESLEPSQALVEYEVNAPLWSDGATKLRWMFLPPGRQIQISGGEPWKYPEGSLFVKHFEYEEEGLRTRLETRVLVRGIHGADYGVTYRWREDQSDADLLIERDERRVGSILWKFPSRADCRTCHNQNAGFVLGVQAHTLGHDQIHGFEKSGWLHPSQSKAKIAILPESHNPYDPNAPLETRAMSYLDANCSQCHRPNQERVNFDLRFVTPVAKKGLIGEAASSGRLLVEPGRPGMSELLLRMRSTGARRMPPLGSHVIDERAAAAIEAWIAQLRPAFEDWQRDTPGAGNLPGSDNDRDGISDLLEYALGGDPEQADPHLRRPLRVQRNESGLEIRFEQPAGSWIDTHIEISTNLRLWYRLRNPVIESEEGGTRTVRYAHPFESHLARALFFRLRVKLGNR